MKDWLHARAPRERVMLGVCASVVVAAVLWLLVWTPLDERHDALRASVADWQAGLTQLERIAATRGSAGSSGQTPSIGGGAPTPVVIVDTTLRTRGLSRSLRRSQPTTGTGIRVEFENVAFDTLVLWLGDLSHHYRMDVQAGSLSVPPRAEPGRINATLTLEQQR